MTFTTMRFGEITCSEEQMVRFPEGILGHVDRTRFVLVDDERTAPFQWLVSAEDPSLALTVLDPALVLDGVDGTLLPAEGQTTFIVATEGSGQVAWWLDLRHPIIIREQGRTGRQVTLDDAGLPARFPVPLAAAGGEA